MSLWWWLCHEWCRVWCRVVVSCGVAEVPLAVWCGLLCSSALEERCRGQDLCRIRACEGTAAEQRPCILLVQNDLQVLVDLREGGINRIAGQE